MAEDSCGLGMAKIRNLNDNEYDVVFRNVKGSVKHGMWFHYFVVVTCVTFIVLYLYLRISKGLLRSFSDCFITVVFSLICFGFTLASTAELILRRKTLRHLKKHEVYGADCKCVDLSYTNGAGSKLCIKLSFNDSEYSRLTGYLSASCAEYLKCFSAIRSPFLPDAFVNGWSAVYVRVGIESYLLVKTDGDLQLLRLY